MSSTTATVPTIRTVNMATKKIAEVVVATTPERVFNSGSHGHKTTHRAKIDGREATVMTTIVWRDTTAKGKAKAAAKVKK